VRLLLDTHVWLWLQAAPGRIDADVLDLLQDLDNELFLSAASAWEIAIKHDLGRLPLPEPPTTYVPDRMRRSGVRPLPISHAHALGVGRLPRLHRDPFDRLLVAQAQLEALDLVTVDRTFDGYDVPVRWARA
jgi:PIN domain nuclease of toxin-antitoxin system